MRNVVESANRNLKRTQFENIPDPDLRAIHGNTFTESGPIFVGVNNWVRDHKWIGFFLISLKS